MNLYFSLFGSDIGVLVRKMKFLIHRSNEIMATIQEVKDAIAAEAVQVKAKLDELQARIDELVAAGTGATPEELEELRVAVENIFTPSA